MQWIMQQDKTKIAILRWHSSPRYKNGLKWLQITWQNIPVEQTSSLSTTYCFLFACSDCGNENQGWERWGPLKIHIDCDIVSEQERERGVCVCVCPQAAASTVLEAAAGENADY